MTSGPWLTYSDGELQKFHPAFEESAQLALVAAGLDTAFEWIHHPPVGSTIRPDFVLRRQSDQKWILIVEIKRTKEDVVSQRYRSQAKSYAEMFQNNYRLPAARYFAISNIEQTFLFALNGARPPVECQIQNGAYSSGDFANQSKASQQQVFISKLVEMLRLVTSPNLPQFDDIWPTVLDDFVNFAQSLELMPEVESSWAMPVAPSSQGVASYFGNGSVVDAARVFLFRCLSAEYLRGVLARANHPQSLQLTALRATASVNTTASLLASAIDHLRAVDFDVVFDGNASTIYRSLQSRPTKQRLQEYIGRITAQPTRVFELARTRIDHRELLETLFSKLYPPEMQDERGKVQTDPELARVLVALAISRSDEKVIDPCCGEGSLLSAAYDHLEFLGASGAQAIKTVSGIEIDPLAAYLASLRIALKRASVLSPAENVSISLNDMFAAAAQLQVADVVLMNPPFKRYEAQSSRPVPQALRDHFNRAIQDVDGVPAQTTGGQANLFAYYVEFTVKVAKPNARLGFVLDNKWFQNSYGKLMRGFLLDNCEIEAIVAYPRSRLFKDFTIATSLLVAKKNAHAAPNHMVQFVRSKVDPGSVDIGQLTNAFHSGSHWPSDWTVFDVRQDELSKRDGWKRYFATDLTQDYRSECPSLRDLFQSQRRGSLNKEEGGVGILEFPFNRSNFGNKRTKYAGGRAWQTSKGQKLTKAENIQLRHLASKIPNNFRGYALKNADDLHGYEVSREDAERNQTIEPPSLRGLPAFASPNRAPWTRNHDDAIIDMRVQKELNAYITAVETIVGLSSAVLPNERLWIALREPFAGELIIPRKTRAGHRVHVNPFALTLSGPQVRISSNFFSYSDCSAIDPISGLDRETATRLIAAFLMSSFGQLQFELQGLDREGALSLDEHSLANIVVFDPRWVRPGSRLAIMAAFADLPYPIRVDTPSIQQEKRNRLDDLFADEFCAKFQMLNKSSLIEEVHSLLDIWTDARQQ